MQRFAEFQNHVEACAKKFLELRAQEVILLHHNDTDGLTSGAIMQRALERLNIKPRRYCLERTYPAVLQKLLREASDQALLLLVDFGSGVLPDLSAARKPTQRIFVLDHHSIQPVNDAGITLVNCMQFGIHGSRDCSASAVCYLFAKALQAWNEDLAPLGVLGALGDRLFDDQGKLTGVNALLSDSLLKSGVLTFDKSYRITIGQNFIADELVRLVNALGSFGYFSGGTDVGLKGLLEGFDERYQIQAKSLEADYQSKFKKLSKEISFHETEFLTWFRLPETFSTSGVKTVGLVCEDLLAQSRVRSDRYLAGFQRVPDEIPGLGKIELKQTKVSMRVPQPLYQKMLAGKAPALTDFLPEATRRLNGSVDGCHAHSAATTIPVGSEEELILEMDRIVAQSIQK